MILVDTSVWIDHFRRGSQPLRELLGEMRVAVHPYVMGELACGRLEKRREILALLGALPETSVVSQTEFLHFVERHFLPGSGIGFIDAHLLASAELMKIQLWSFDKSLHRAAVKLQLSYRPG